MALLRKRLDSPRTVAITGTLLQAAVWLYIAALLADSYSRNVVQSSTSTGEFYGEVYGTFFFAGSLCLIGFLVSVDAAVRRQYRGRWFFWASIVLSIPLCILYPVGTVLGFGFVLYLGIKYKEFGEATASRPERNCATNDKR